MKTTFVAMRVQITGPSVEPLIEWLRGLGSQGKVLETATRQALVLGVLRNVRQRFLERMARAQNVFIDNSGESSRRERVQAMAKERSAQRKAKVRLNRAYERLDRAVLANDKDGERAARRYLRRKELDAVFSTFGIRGAGRKAGGLSEARATRILVEQQMKDVKKGNRLRLGVLLNGLMKQRQMEVLRALTSASTIAVERGANSITMSTGNKDKLDDIHTPSAAGATSGRTSPSRKKTLWRQLEFGAGATRIASTLNPVQPSEYSLPGGGWFFGPLPRTLYRSLAMRDDDQRTGAEIRAGALAKWGLRVRGIKPMQFLFPSGNGIYAEDAEDALKYFDDAVRASMPRL